MILPFTSAARERRRLMTEHDALTPRIDALRRQYAREAEAHQNTSSTWALLHGLLHDRMMCEIGLKQLGVWK